MKTLDEVIEILEKVVKHDYVWFDEKTALMKIDTLADTLNWLKGYQQHIELDKIRDHLARQNNPLSWEELVTMIGIPVWVEIEKNSSLWAIPMSITTLGNNERMCMVGSENGHAVQIEVCKDSTNGWKAYLLKEHRYG